MTVRILTGDCREVLPTLDAGSVHCCVTSPPYWGLRDYGHDGQIGLEETPEEYTQNLVEVFREVGRVLKDDGTLWLNLGDSYGGGHGGNKTNTVEAFVRDLLCGGITHHTAVGPGLATDSKKWLILTIFTADR